MLAAADVTANPALGILIFALGGLAGAVFYLPFKKVKAWAWESYWLVYAVFGLVLVPWILAFSTSPNVLAVLKASPGGTLAYCCLCGAAWGLGGLTWGLMIRYLGVGLGLALGCGLCSAAGTIVPAIIKGEFAKLLESSAGIASLAGVLVSLAGIVFVGMAGMSKESELPEEEKKKAVAEFNFKKGILIAVFSGIMSAAMNFGLQGGPLVEFKANYGSETLIAKGTQIETPAGKKEVPPESLAAAQGLFLDRDSSFWVAPKAAAGEALTSKPWRGMPLLVVVLFGGFVVNGLWCLFLNFKNKTTGDYAKAGAPIIANIVFAGVAGAIWCSQFICFKTGEPQMGELGYVGWSMLMASAILFSTLLGIILGEWKGTSTRTKSRLAAGLAMLLLSAVVGGASGYLAEQAKKADAAAKPAAADVQK